MAQIGTDLLQAANSIVQNFSQQQEMRLRALQLEQQVRTQNEVFDLQRQEMDLREKNLELQQKQEQRLQARQKLELPGLELEAALDADPIVRDADRRRRIASADTAEAQATLQSISAAIKKSVGAEAAAAFDQEIKQAELARTKAQTAKLKREASGIGPGPGQITFPQAKKNKADIEQAAANAISSALTRQIEQEGSPLHGLTFADLQELKKRLAPADEGATATILRQVFADRLEAGKAPPSKAQFLQNIDRVLNEIRNPSENPPIEIKFRAFQKIMPGAPGATFQAMFAETAPPFVTKFELFGEAARDPIVSSQIDEEIRRADAPALTARMRDKMLKNGKLNNDAMLKFIQIINDALPPGPATEEKRNKILSDMKEELGL
jgi:hypothetical protein